MAVINLDGEDFLSFAEAARTLPGHPNPSTLWRWRTCGIRGIRLETILVGGRRYVSRQALIDFIDALTKADECRAPVPSDPISEARIPKRTAEMERRLKANRLL